jgi:hypothetical protein
MSAPWLLLPFAVGGSRRRARSRGGPRPTGLVASGCALTGYLVMIVSPAEAGHWSLRGAELRGPPYANLLNISGALVTGPPTAGWGSAGGPGGRCPARCSRRGR